MEENCFTIVKYAILVCHNSFSYNVFLVDK